MIGQVLLGLSFLIVLHELGHFLAARAFGIKVEKFYLFFDAWGAKLFSFNYKGCEYGIGWLPLGGYVKIAGMIDESMDTEQLKSEPTDSDYRSKPAWQRLIVMLGGVIVNIIVGVVIFWLMIFNLGETDIDNTRLMNGVVPGIIGKEVGIQTGDRITAINGRPAINFFQDIAGSSEVLMGDAVLTVIRADQEIKITMPADVLNKVADHKATEFVQPRMKMTAVNMVVDGSEADKMGLLKGDSIINVNGREVVFFDQFKAEIEKLANKDVALKVIRNNESIDLKGKVSADATIGFNTATDASLPIIRKEYSLMESFPIGAAKAFSVITDNIKGFGKIFKGEVRADKALAGPVGIATMFGKEVDWVRFWSLVGMLSMALAFMNLLPIPALDGGHVIFLTVEIIQGKPLSDNFLEKAQMVGFFILIGLMIFVFGNDIFKLIK